MNTLLVAACPVPTDNTGASLFFLPFIIRDLTQCHPVKGGEGWRVGRARGQGRALKARRCHKRWHKRTAHLPDEVTTGVRAHVATLAKIGFLPNPGAEAKPRAHPVWATHLPRHRCQALISCAWRSPMVYTSGESASRTPVGGVYHGAASAFRPESAARSCYRFTF